MMAEVIGTAFLVPAETVLVPVRPGLNLAFRSGYTEITDEESVRAVLRKPNVTLHLTPRYETHYRQFVDGCGEFEPARAKIALPDGLILTPPEYKHPYRHEE